MRQRIDQRAIIAGAALGLLLITLLGYLLLISPQRSKVRRLDGQINETQASIESNRILRTKKVETVRIADLFRLTKAMPDQTNMPDLLLQLSRVAREAGIQFDSVTPQPVSTGTGYTSVPIDLVFQGNFYELSDFLYRLRNLVGVRDGHLDATGRLFSVNGIEFAEGENNFPQLQASLQVDAFVYGNGSGATSSATTETTTAPGSTTPAQTTTTPAATTPATTPSSSAAALGAIP